MRKKREHEAKGGVVSRPSFLQSTTKANHDPDLRKKPKTPDTAIFNCITVQERIRMFAPWFKTFSTFGKTSTCATGSAAFIYLFICLFVCTPCARQKTSKPPKPFISSLQAGSLPPSSKENFPLNSHKWTCPQATSDHPIWINGTNFLPPTAVFKVWLVVRTEFELMMYISKPALYQLG